jgi:sterol desaturase/sphingolipid hydroxylase (fatty acid hydroxylase superfamily)
VRDSYDVDLTDWLEAYPSAEFLLTPVLQLIGSRFDTLWLFGAGALTLGWVLWANRFATTDTRWLPWRVYFSPSARIDYLCFALFPTLLAGALSAGIHPWHESAISERALAWLGISQVSGFDRPLAGAALVGTWLLFIVAGVAGDFSQWCAHVACHRVPWLWRWHRLHHSAQVLTPFTGAREHPFIQWIDRAVYATAVGIVLAVAQWVWPTSLEQLYWLEGGVAVFTLYWLAFLTNHCHVPVTFGPLEGLVVSPAYHAIHHINSPRYLDCNYGHILTCWDRLLGTYIRASQSGDARGEMLAFGVPSTVHMPHRSVWVAFARHCIGKH